ncbi:MAG TPA: twin-arginine translocase subunit TatC [Alphaproteobacteria bacterium]|jgi:sec-independent protein translocase protein TatC|nr:twin-arginine translocase subunit TatC [Alphaproteobacteria bacterium]
MTDTTTTEENPDDKKMPLMEHLIELRRRLVWSLVAFAACFVIAFIVANPIFDFLTRPLATIWEGQEGRHLIYTALQEKFFANVKVAMFGGLVLAFPIIAAQVWGFVAPGLYRNEKSAFLPFLVATPIMFMAGASFVYFIFIPNAFRFFASFEEVAKNGALAITAEPKVSEYLDLIIQLILGFGIVFELPVLLTLLVSAELLETKTLAKNRRYAIVLGFIVSAILTPPDALSMMMMAVPLVGLYEISIVIGRIIEARRRRRRLAEEAEEAKLPVP